MNKCCITSLTAFRPILYRIIDPKVGKHEIQREK